MSGGLAVEVIERLEATVAPRGHYSSPERGAEPGNASNTLRWRGFRVEHELCVELLDAAPSRSLIPNPSDQQQRHPDSARRVETSQPLQTSPLSAVLAGSSVFLQFSPDREYQPVQYRRRRASAQRA